MSVCIYMKTRFSPVIFFGQTYNVHFDDAVNVYVSYIQLYCSSTVCKCSTHVYSIYDVSQRLHMLTSSRLIQQATFLIPKSAMSGHSTSNIFYSFRYNASSFVTAIHLSISRVVGIIQLEDGCEFMLHYTQLKALYFIKRLLLDRLQLYQSHTYNRSANHLQSVYQTYLQNSTIIFDFKICALLFTSQTLSALQLSRLIRLKRFLAILRRF